MLAWPREGAPDRPIMLNPMKHMKWFDPDVLKRFDLASRRGKKVTGRASTAIGHARDQGGTRGVYYTRIGLW